MSAFLGSACKTDPPHVTGIVGDSDNSSHRPPAAWPSCLPLVPLTPSDALVCEGVARDWPTPQQDCQGSVGSVPSHLGGLWGTLIGAVLRERALCLTWAPHLRGGVVPGIRDGAPRPARGRPIFYGSKVTGLHWGAPPGSPGDRDTGQYLRGAARHPHRTAGGPSCACGGIPHDLLSVNVMRDDREYTGGRPRPGLLGDDLLSPRLRLVPTRPRRQHHRGLLSSTPPDSQ